MKEKVTIPKEIRVLNSNFQTHHTENRLRGKAGGGGGWARWLLSTDSLLRAWTALGTALNGSWGALVIIPGGRLPFPTVSLKLLAPPPTLPPPWKLFHLLTGPLLATWCPLPGPRSWLVCLCILSFSLSSFHPPSLLFPSQPSVATLHNPDDSSFASILLSSSLFFFFYSVIRPSATSSRFPIPLHSFSFYFHLIFFLSSLRTFIQIGMLYTVDERYTSDQKLLRRKGMERVSRLCRNEFEFSS